MEPLSLHHRSLIRRDMPEVLAIENESCEFPWADDDFFGALRRRDCVARVVEHGELVVGFVIFDLCKTHLHLQKLAVDPRYRRRGVGAAMVTKLIGRLSPHRRTRITLEVRETNLDAQRFFRATGFLAEAVQRAFYPDSGEDAFRLSYRLGASFAIKALSLAEVQNADRD